MFILALQSSWWGRESWLLCLICLPGVLWWLSGSSSRCHGVVCSLWLWYSLIILTFYFCSIPSVCPSVTLSCPSNISNIIWDRHPEFGEWMHLEILFVCLFCCFTSQVNSYGHCGTVSSPNHTFFLGKLEQAVNQYFVHILSLVTDNNPSWMIQRKGGEWPLKLFHDQSTRKYGTGPGSNSRPLNLQSDSHLLPDTLPTALRGPVHLEITECLVPFWGHCDLDHWPNIENIVSGAYHLHYLR